MMPRCIDADALRNEFSERPPDYYSTSYILDSIDSAPTVSPDDVRGVGKWEDVSVHDNIRSIMIASMRCNVCKRYHNEVYYCGDPTEMARFCQNCGAKMEVMDDA